MGRSFLHGGALDGVVGDLKDSTFVKVGDRFHRESESGNSAHKGIIAGRGGGP